MAPARRSARSKAETAGNKTEIAPKVPATRVAKKTKSAAAKEAAIMKETIQREAVEEETVEEETVEKETEEKSVRRSTRARKGINVETEKEQVEAEGGNKQGIEENKIEKNGIEEADITPAVPESQPAPASDIGSTKLPVKVKVTRSRAAKGKSAVTVPVEEEVFVDETTVALAAPAPTVRRSTRGNRGVSEAPADSTITVVPPVEKPKRGKKVTSEIFETSAVESAAAASSSATPHWAKRRESKTEEQVEPIAGSGEGNTPEKATAKGKKRKAAVSKKGKGKVREVQEEPKEPEEPEAKEPETDKTEAEAEELEVSKNIEAIGKINTPIEEPIQVVEEEPTIDNDPATDYGVAVGEPKNPPKAAKPSKKATATAKKTAVKKALVTRKSARGKKIEEVAQAAENEDEAAPPEQTDLPQVITESSQKVNDEEMAPNPASESSQVTDVDDFHGEDADQAPKTQDSGVFIESFRSTQDMPATVPGEQVDTKTIEQQQLKGDGRNGGSMPVGEVRNESASVTALTKDTSSGGKAEEAESSVTATRNDPKNQVKDATEKLFGADSLPTNKTKVPKPRKKSAATKKKERAAAIKKAKSQPQSETDADGDVNVDAEPEVEVGHKNALSSARVIDPAAVLGPRKSGGIKKATTTRRGRSAAAKQEIATTETIQEDQIMSGQGNNSKPEIIGEKLKSVQEDEPIDAVLEGTSVRQGPNEAIARVSEDVLDETIHKEIAGKTLEEAITAHDEDEDFALPMSKPIILSPTRFTSPDPNLDPIKSSVPSSPVTFNVSHPQLHSSPLRNASQEPVLASPGSVTTPRGPSPIKKWATPNKHTPSRLSQSGTPFKNLEDSRDIRKVASTPTRALNVDVQSSPVMMPPPTPDVLAGDGRSPVKQTPTKEPLAGDVVLSNSKVTLEMENKGHTNSSPVKNPTPIKADSFILSSPAGRLSFSEDLPSPAARKLESGIPLLKSPVTSGSSISSPIKKTKLDFLRNTKTSALSSSPSWNLSFTSGDDDGDDEDDEGDNVGDDTFADRESVQDEDLVRRLGEEGVSIESVHKEVVDQEETYVEKPMTIFSNIPQEEEKNEAGESSSSNLDESALFKLLDKARNAVEQEEPAPLIPESKGDIAECDLTFTVSDNDFDEDIPSSPLEGSPLKPQEFSYEPTASIFPPKPDSGEEEGEKEESDTEVFSPIVINKQSAQKGEDEDTDWGVDEEDGKGIRFHLDPESPGGRLQEFRTSSPPNIWGAQEAKAANLLLNSSPRTADQPGDETEFEKSYARGQEEEGGETPRDIGDDTFEKSYIRGLDTGSDKSYEGINLLPDEEAQKTLADVDNTFEQSYIRGLDAGSDQSYDGINLLPDEDVNKTPQDMDNTFEQSYARGIDTGSDQEYEGINLLPDEEKEGGVGEEIGEDTQFEMSFMRGVEDEKEQIRKEKEENIQREREARIAKGRKRFLEDPQEDFQALKKSKGRDGRRLTFHPDEPVSKKTTSKKTRRMSDSTLSDRQYYLKHSRPDEVQTNWEEHIKRVRRERLAVSRIQRAYRAYRAYRAACAETTEAPTKDEIPVPPATEVGEVPTITKGSALLHPPVRPSRLPERVTRKSQSPSLSALLSSSGAGRIKRKAADNLETGGRPIKSNIPVSMPDPMLTMCNRHTTQNGLFSVGIKFKTIKKPFPRPSEAALDAASRKAAQESKERRCELTQETGCMLHPGEEEEWVSNSKSKVRWDPELVSICDDEEGRAPPEEDKQKKLPVRGVLKAPPPLTVHGNWVPVANAPPLQISREPVEVSRVVYLGEYEQKEPVYGKKKSRK